MRVGTIVNPRSCTLPISEAISFRCRSSFRSRSGSWFRSPACSYGAMWEPTSQSSPSRMSAYERFSSALPSRSDLTSEPSRTRPASWRSSRWYSWRARRFSAISFSPVIRSLCRCQLDLPLRPVDLGDDDVDRVAETECPLRAAADERGAEVVQLVVVAAEPPRRQKALEDLAETGEEPRADHAVDLALERRLPAAVEQHGLEQPGEADVVGPVLDVGVAPLLHRGVLGVLAGVLRQRLVGGAELPEERTVDDEIGVAPDRRGEVAVRRAREPRVSAATFAASPGVSRSGSGAGGVGTSRSASLERRCAIACGSGRS